MGKVTPQIKAQNYSEIHNVYVADRRKERLRSCLEELIDLLEKKLDRGNLNKVFKKVKSNKGTDRI